MDVRKLMLMVGALALAVVCAIMARSMFTGGTAPEAAAAPTPEPSGPEVLVATRTLTPGTILGPDSFRYQRWPSDLVDQAYYVRSDQPVNLQGTVVRFPIPAGQPISQGAVIKPGDRGFLAAALAPGMRAVTISVSQQSGVAGFVFPGDRVDLLLTQTVAGEGQPLRAAETMVRNVRVLATDQRTDKTTDDQGKTVVQTFSNVTLETTPKLAEKIAVAQTIGQISLSLRSISDDRMELERAIAEGEINVPDSKDPRATKAMLLEYAARPNDRNTTFTTGAEVSRFQRGSMPRASQTASAGIAPTPSASSGPLVVRGPVVVVARGNNVTQVPVPGGR